MKTKRIRHDCVLIEDSGSLTVYVAGGKDDNNSNDFDSIESLKLINTNISQNEWKLETTVLPMPLADFQMVRSNDKDILFYVVAGEVPNEEIYGSKIYGLTKLKKWKEMGSLRAKRCRHQTLNLPLSYLKGCQ